MHCPLTLLFQGEDLVDAEISVQRLLNGRAAKAPTTGLRVRSQHNAESPNYLFADMDVLEAGEYRITLRKGKRTTYVDYTIYSREPGSRERSSFSSADLIYLIMSDRFVDGDECNNTLPSLAEAADKSNVRGRWGGDIAGIVQTLDHIVALGATAIWPTPLLLDNQPRGSYHGYSCSDYYHIDPRYGSNAEYKDMVRIAHEKGLKVLMDMVPNHCGGAHWWMQDLPFSDWVNTFDDSAITNHIFSANYDVNASEYDRELNARGWFAKPSMPDNNLSHPDVLQYFKQWAIWWIEYADLDGLRVDTYPYLEKYAGAEWCRAIREEYPEMNIVGECWTTPASAVAYWQQNSTNPDGFNSYLPSVMDFPLNDAIRTALGSDGHGWNEGLLRVYQSLAQDYLYADVNHLLIFLDNHDMDRITDVVKDKDLARVRLAYTMLATLRGIPQVLYGDEYACVSADMTKGHFTLRMPLPLQDTLTEQQKEMFDFQSRLFRWRKSEPILHHGRTMHFASRDNTYAYVRYTDDGAVFVFINASDEPRRLPVYRYAEILDKYSYTGVNPLTGDTVTLDSNLSVPPLSSLIITLR